jgi:hypothetical protein
MAGKNELVESRYFLPSLRVGAVTAVNAIDLPAEEAVGITTV